MSINSRVPSRMVRPKFKAVMRVCSAKKCSSLATQTKANLSPNIKETFKLKGRVIKPVAQPAKVFGVSGASSAFRATRVN